MSLKGNTDNGILRVDLFGLKLNIPPIYFSSLYIHHLTFCPKGHHLLHEPHIYPFSFLFFFFKHNFYRAPPHLYILVAFELDQRQDGTTFLFSS